MISRKTKQLLASERGGGDDVDDDLIAAVFCLWGVGSAIVAGTYVASLSRSSGAFTVAGARHRVDATLAARSDRPQIRHGGAFIGLTVLLVAVLFTKRYAGVRRRWRVVLAGACIGAVLGAVIAILP